MFDQARVIGIVVLCWLAGWTPTLRAACVGAADCHACSSCSSCKHCSKNGGSCGAKLRLSAKPVVPAKPAAKAPAIVVGVKNEADYLEALTSLCDPAKLSTLGDRGANSRLKKIVYWLDYPRHEGKSTEQVIDLVLAKNGYKPEHSALIKTNLLRNIKIGDQLGFFTPENLELLRRGGAPLVNRGPYKGQKAAVDHIIPFSVAPEIGNDMANLELMPTTLNLRKSAKVGPRQKALARDLHAAGVLDEKALARVLNVKNFTAEPVEGIR